MLANITQNDIAYFGRQMERWVKPSHIAMRQQPNRIKKLHGLAAIDAELRLEEKQIQVGMYAERYSVDPVQQARLMTLSELWVMGAYEFVRRWHQLSNAKDVDYPKREILAIGDLKHELARVRIPLTKEEAPGSGTYKDDPGVLFQAHWDDGCAGWIIKADTAIKRSELADKFIDTLELVSEIERGNA